MLWVTMTTVTSSAISLMVCSMRRVEVGSRAEHGSSMSRTRGRTASARAMHSRCCWPPERAPPSSPSRSLTSFHRPALVSISSTRSARLPGETRENLRPESTLSAMVMAGNGLGFWNTMPMCRRVSTARWPGTVDVEAVELHRAGQLGAGDHLVHPVEDAEEGRLPAARRPDQRRHLGPLHVRVTDSSTRRPLNQAQTPAASSSPAPPGVGRAWPQPGPDGCRPPGPSRRWSWSVSSLSIGTGHEHAGHEVVLAGPAVSWLPLGPAEDPGRHEQDEDDGHQHEGRLEGQIDRSPCWPP